MLREFKQGLSINLIWNGIHLILSSFRFMIKTENWSIYLKLQHQPEADEGNVDAEFDPPQLIVMQSQTLTTNNKKILTEPHILRFHQMKLNLCRYQTEEMTNTMFFHY